MADIRKINACFLLLALLLLIGAEDGTAVRVRSHSRSRKTKTRIGTTNTRMKVRRYTGPVYRSSYWKTGMAIGLVYGLTRYKTRRMYLRYPDREPRVCFNEYDLRNGTYGYFICPEWDQPDDYVYCCGDEGQQWCCDYFGSSTSRRGGKRGSGAQGRTAGIVIGALIVCVIIGVAVYCICVRRRRRKAEGHVVRTNESKTGAKGSAVGGGQEQMIPLSSTVGPSQYPYPGTSAPGPPQYGGYGTGMSNPDMPYNPNPAAYPTGAGAAPYPGSYTSGGFTGDMTKQPLPPSDMSAGMPYPMHPGTAVQDMPYPPGQPTISPPPYPPN